MPQQPSQINCVWFACLLAFQESEFDRIAGQYTSVEA